MTAKILTALALLLAVFTVLMLSPMDPFTRGGTPGTDSAVFQYIGWEVGNGKVPYRDLFDHKGPLLFFLNWLGSLIAPVGGVWWVEALSLLGTAFFVYKTARRALGRGYSLLVVVLSLAPLRTYFETGNLTEEYAMLFQAAAAYIFLDFFTAPEQYEQPPAKGGPLLHRGNRWFSLGVALCGLCFAGVFLLRANMIALWIAFCLAVLVYCVRGKKWPTLGRFILSFLLGALVLLLPTAAYFAAHGALGDFIEGYFLFNMRFASAGVSARLTMLEYFANTLPALLSLAILAVKVKRGWGKGDANGLLFDCGWLAYLLLALALASMSGQDCPHYGMTLCPAFVYPFCVMCKALGEREARRARVDIVVVAYLLLAFLVPNWGAMAKNAAKDVMAAPQNGGWYENEVVAFVRDHTAPGDEITMFGNEDAYYLYTERGSASRYSYQFPLCYTVPEMVDEYFGELEEAQPAAVVWVINLQDQRMAQPPAFTWIVDLWDGRMAEFLEDNGYSLALDGDIWVYLKD